MSDEPNRNAKKDQRDRLKLALRANLKRRKSQLRGRTDDDVPSEDSEADQADTPSVISR